MDFMQDDGGRWAAGFRPRKAGDCGVRAIAIAADLSYSDVWQEAYERNERRFATEGPRLLRKYPGLNWDEKRHPRLRRTRREEFLDPDCGMSRAIMRPWAAELGFTWVPTMHIGAGTTVHLRDGEIPSTGRLILSLSRHFSAVIDGVNHDTHDPSKGGTRCVYGYWVK